MIILPSVISEIIKVISAKIIEKPGLLSTNKLDLFLFLVNISGSRQKKNNQGYLSLYTSPKQLTVGYGVVEDGVSS